MRSPTSPSPSVSHSAPRSGGDAHAVGVHVNLLPKEAAERVRARRLARYTAVALAMLVVALGLGYVVRLGAVYAATQAREDAQLEVATLEQELGQLAEFRELADRHDNGNQLVAAAMANELSFSTVLSDLSLSVPSTASLRTLNVTATTLVGAAAAPAAEPGAVDLGERVADVTFSGYTLGKHAPGVSSVLIDFDDVPAFFGTYLVTTSEDRIGERDVTNFDGTARLDETARTDRYTNGLPPEDTP